MQPSSLGSIAAIRSRAGQIARRDAHNGSSAGSPRTHILDPDEEEMEAVREILSGLFSNFFLCLILERLLSSVTGLPRFRSLP